jgi:NTE family protein
MMKLGISLSGGGIRATVFHLGALARLAQTDYWNKITRLSTVSGGSLCIGLIFQLAGHKWPDENEYREIGLPNAFSLLTQKSLQKSYVLNILLRPWRLLQGRAHVLSKSFEKVWGISGNVADMPDIPFWVINATCYESGKNWRFSHEKMGDYITNYVYNPSFPLADALSCSAAVPGLIGPLKIKTKKYKWFKFESEYAVKPISKDYTIWDGGVYDNLGAEYLYKPGQGFQHDIDFYFASDASARLGLVDRKWIWNYPLPSFKTRLINIATDQVRSLRVRELYNVFFENKNGGVLRIGETAEYILKHQKYKEIDQINFSKCLNQDQTDKAALFETTLRKLSKNEFQLLFRHGFETMSAVLTAVLLEQFVYFNIDEYKWLE